MRYSQLKAFHAVARWGGFSAAARKINLTQPAVSDHISRLEETYGVQLFVRSSRSASLTDVGRKLFVLSEKWLEAETEARDLLLRARGLREGRLNIGADAAVHVLPLLRRFRQRYPAVSVSLTAGNSDTLLAGLQNLDTDFAVVADKPDDPRFRARRLSRAAIAAFCAATHPLAARASISLEHLVREPLVLREQGSVTRRLFDQVCRQRKLALPAPVEIEGREAAREAVAAGLGLGMTSKAEFPDDPRLHLLEISDWHAEMNEWLVCLEARTGLHMISALLELV